MAFMLAVTMALSSASLAIVMVAQLMVSGLMAVGSKVNHSFGYNYREIISTGPNFSLTSFEPSDDEPHQPSRLANIVSNQQNHTHQNGDTRHHRWNPEIV